MLNLSMNEQKEIFGGRRWKTVIFDANGKQIRRKTFDDWREAEDWGEYQAAHNGRTYNIYQVGR